VTPAPHAAVMGRARHARDAAGNRKTSFRRICAEYVQALARKWAFTGSELEMCERVCEQLCRALNDAWGDQLTVG